MPSKTPESSGSTQKPAEMSQPSKKSSNTVKNSGNSAKTGSNPAKDNKTLLKSSALLSQLSSPTTTLATLAEASETYRKENEEAVVAARGKKREPIQDVLSNLKTTEELKDYWKQGNGSRQAIELEKLLGITPNRFRRPHMDETDSEDVKETPVTLAPSTSRSIAVPCRKFSNSKDSISIEPVIQSYDQLTKEFVADLISKIQSSVIRQCGDRIFDDHSSYEKILQLGAKSPLSKRSKAAHSRVQSFFLEAFRLIQKMEDAWRIDGSKFGDDREYVSKILDSNAELRIKMSEISHEKLQSMIDECCRSALNLEKGEPVTRNMSGFLALLKSLEVYDGVAATVDKLKKEFPNWLGCFETSSNLESLNSEMSGLELNETPKAVENPSATPSESSPEPTENSAASVEPDNSTAPEKPAQAPNTSETKNIKCIPCNERIKLLKDVMDDIKEAEIKAALFENDAKKTDATEVVIRDMKKRMEGMEKAKKEVKAAIESRRKDVEKIEMEGEQLKEKKKGLEGDLEKKKQETTDLQVQNTELVKEIKAMKLKMDRMPTAPAEAPQMPNPVEVSTKPALLEWRAKKDAFNKDASLQEKKDKIQSIRLLTADPKMWSFMEYEIFHFNSTCQIYLEVIEMNIEKIKKTSNTSDLLPLPPYPEITEQFQIALELLLAQPQEPEDDHEAGNDPQKNCYICRNNFVHGDQVLICKTCKKPVHQRCWMEWLTKQNIKTEDQQCGLCRGPMVVRK